MTTTTVRRGTKSRRRANIKKYLPIYLIVLPSLLYFFVFHYVPMAGLVIAFKKVSPFQGLDGVFTAPWVGLTYFKKFFNSYYFGNLMSNTIVISLKKLLWGFPAPVLLALLLNELRNEKFKRVVQTVSYLQHFVSMVVLAGLVNTLLTTNGGVVNQLIAALGGEPIYFLGQPAYFHGVLVVSGIWKEAGWGTIIYLAAISGIDPALYEAAIVDGAGRLRRMWHITIPGISSIVVIMLILNVGRILNAGFEQILLLYSPPVYSVADIIDTYVYREGIVNLQYSFTTAVGLFKSVAALILVVSANLVANRLGEQGIW
ncbi:MAG: sugar ABC transporter permease [Clostridiales bacterium]|nr:sugar ABC transporter permease [Clostridiales bacterium]